MKAVSDMAYATCTAAVFPSMASSVPTFGLFGVYDVLRA